MKRRNFIKFTTIGVILFSTNITIARTIPQKTLLILDEILNIIFPKTSTMPNAKEFKGKDSVLAKDININSNASHNVKPNQVSHKKIEHKV